MFDEAVLYSQEFDKALRMVRVMHRRATGMQVAAGFTCLCNEWDGNDITGEHHRMKMAVKEYAKLTATY